MKRTLLLALLLGLTLAPSCSTTAFIVGASATGAVVAYSAVSAAAEEALEREFRIEAFDGRGQPVPGATVGVGGETWIDATRTALPCRLEVTFPKETDTNLRGWMPAVLLVEAPGYKPARRLLPFNSHVEQVFYLEEEAE